MIMPVPNIQPSPWEMTRTDVTMAICLTNRSTVVLNHPGGGIKARVRFNRINTAECRGESGKSGNQRNGDGNKSRQGSVRRSKWNKMSFWIILGNEPSCGKT